MCVGAYSDGVVHSSGSVVVQTEEKQRECFCPVPAAYHLVNKGLESACALMIDGVFLISSKSFAS